MESLTELTLTCDFFDFEVDLPKHMFRGWTYLEDLTLENCFFHNLSDEHFQNLANLRSLDLQHARFADFKWLRYVILLYKSMFNGC